MGFIYKVTNKVNNKIYIGKTLHSIERRFKEHVLEAKRIPDRPFHYAINKYGEENFLIELLEEVSNEEINEKEKYWIEFYRSYIGYEDSIGYNATLGGDGTIKYNYDEIAQDYLKTESRAQTARNFNCSLEVVDNAKNTYNINTISNCSGRPIQKISEFGEIIIYDSIRKAAEELANETGRNIQTVRKRITDVINNKPYQKAYGFNWKSL